MLCNRRHFQIRFVASHTRNAWRCAALLCGAVLWFASAPVFGQGAEQIRVYQDMLTWTTEYEGLIDGVAGRETDRAIKKFQSRMGYPVTGNLTETQGDELVKQGNEKKRRAGFKQIVDNDAGISVGVPENFVSAPTKTKWGKHWYSKQAGLAIDTLRFVDVTLDELYDRLINIKNRRIAYQRKLDNWFVIAAFEKDSKGNEAAVYVRADLVKTTGKDEIRGFSIWMSKDRPAEYQAIPPAMLSSFRSQQSTLASLPSGGSGGPLEGVRSGQSTPPPPPPPRNAPPIVANGPAASALDCWNGLGRDCPMAFR